MNYKLIVPLLITLALVSCDDSPSYEVSPFLGLPESIPRIKANEHAISKLNFEGVWPLKVSSGILGCENQAVYLIINQNAYSLNDSSYSYSKNNKLGWIKLMPNSLLWRTNLSTDFNKDGMADLLSAALKLC